LRPWGVARRRMGGRQAPGPLLDAGRAGARTLMSPGRDGSARVFVGFGGNLGDVLGTFRSALEELRAGGLERVRPSSLYRSRAMTDPVHPPSGEVPDYWNAVVGAESALSPRELLELLLQVERHHGRD